MKVNTLILLALLCAFLFLASTIAIDDKKSANEGQLNAAKQGQGGGGHGGGHGSGGHGGGGHGGGCKYGCCGGYGRGGSCTRCCSTAQESLAYMQKEVNHP
ncbi:hypothetical protein RND71_014891 [Anisodus tanguticus]|uniref:Uncharacterized protein n=1 Tax=Anisodus tanguticus TaxID=243964 RepID=A0AAE1SDM2_9SOLA|nr:hypothetical protein RND71_014891 [Anisodus tanguticus]